MRLLQGSRRQVELGSPNTHEPPRPPGPSTYFLLLIFRACSLAPKLPGTQRTFCSGPGRRAVQTGAGLAWGSSPAIRGISERSDLAACREEHVTVSESSPHPALSQRSLATLGQSWVLTCWHPRELEVAPRQAGNALSEDRAAAILLFCPESLLHPCLLPSVSQVWQSPLTPEPEEA